MKLWVNYQGIVNKLWINQSTQIIVKFMVQNIVRSAGGFPVGGIAPSIGPGGPEAGHSQHQYGHTESLHNGAVLKLFK